MPQPIELHYWPTPNGWKVSIALEEMGLPYELKPVNIGAGEQHEPEFRRISPNGRMPAIVDPEGPGGKSLAIFESGAILLHLARKSGRFYGEDDASRSLVEQWLFWQVGGLGPMAGQANHFRVYAPSMLPDARMTSYGANRYANEVHRLFGVMESVLRERDYLAGDYSIADMASWPWAIVYKNFGIDREEFPKVSAWIDRVGERPAVQKGRALGEELRRTNLASSSADADKQRAVLFGQRSRA